METPHYLPPGQGALPGGEVSPPGEIPWTPFDHRPTGLAMTGRVAASHVLL